jgi:hypothetical protein
MSGSRGSGGRVAWLDRLAQLAGVSGGRLAWLARLAGVSGGWLARTVRDGPKRRLHLTVLAWACLCLTGGAEVARHSRARARLAEVTLTRQTVALMLRREDLGRITQIGTWPDGTSRAHRASRSSHGCRAD